MGVVRVPDVRLDRLSELYQPQKTIHATIEYMDTPGSIIELARSGVQAGYVAGRAVRPFPPHSAKDRGLQCLRLCQGERSLRRSMKPKAEFALHQT